MRQYIQIPLVLVFINITFFINAQTISFIVKDGEYAEAEEINQKANGFKGIWYMNQPSNDEYVYKYSGGLATYTAKHRPFAIYAEEEDKTYFCFGGTDATNSTLFHNISYYNHKNGKVANPTIILDKNTTDAHDNPVISLDNNGYIWVFSTSHGTTRPSYIYKSKQPFDISKFERINATELVKGLKQPFDNFSYFQVYYIKGKGFFAFFTRYQAEFAKRVIGFNTSNDGYTWNEWEKIAYIEEGHYGISGENNGRISIAFNYHPEGQGLNYRTNLYYMESVDFGESWYAANGEQIKLPLTKVKNKALVHDYKSEQLNCYLKDLNYDEKGNPLILVVSSKGYQSGPENNPRTWEVFRYDDTWNKTRITTSDNNYDMGSLYIEPEGKWRLIAPTQTGPQAYNPGGEVEMWVSNDRGKSWENEKSITSNSPRNHTYIRRPINAYPEFYAFWADGHGRKPSVSCLYFCDRTGNVYLLPQNMKRKEVKVKPGFKKHQKNK